MKEHPEGQLLSFGGEVSELPSRKEDVLAFKQERMDHCCKCSRPFREMWEIKMFRFINLDVPIPFFSQPVF